MRCVSCGYPFDHVVPAYRWLRARRAAPPARAPPPAEAVLERLQEPVGDLLDLLQVYAVCCRMHLSMVVRPSEFM